MSFPARAADLPEDARGTNGQEEPDYMRISRMTGPMPQAPSLELNPIINPKRKALKTLNPEP